MHSRKASFLALLMWIDALSSPMTDRLGEERSQLCPAEMIEGRQTVDETRAVLGPRSGDDKFAAMQTSA
jgi:hypothetical protein